MSNNQIKNQINHINELKFKDIFLNDCKYTDITDITDKNFKVLYKKIDNLYLVLFGVDVVNIKKNNYLPYIYYLDKNNVKFKQIKKQIKKQIFGFNFGFNSGFNLENKTFEEISKIKLGDTSYTTLLLNSLTDLLNSTNTINNTSSKQKLENLRQKLENKIYPPQLQQQEQFSQQQLQQQEQFSPQQLQQQDQLQKLQQQEQLQKLQETFMKNKLKNEQNELNQEQQKSPPIQSHLKINELKSRLKNLKKSINIYDNYNRQIIKKKLENNILNELNKINKNPENQNIEKIIKKLQKENLQKQLHELKILDYICKDPGLEVNFESIDKIFFGYDLSLFVKSQNGEYKLYYKYSYHDSKFYELKKQDEDLREEIIDIGLIPTYDILCLYEIIENKENNSNLIEKLIERITIAKQNISKTDKKFFRLTNSNFEKESKENIPNKPNKKNITNSRYKNFGKVKRKHFGTTHIFFGAKLTESTNNRSSSQDFSYVCFEDKDKVFYYKKNQLNKNNIKYLFDFPYIYPLEDLLSFILLRRLITSEEDFAKNIYEEAKKTIKFLKTKKFKEKIIKNENPHNFQVTPQGLIPLKNFEQELIKNENQHNFKVTSQGLVTLKNFEQESIKNKNQASISNRLIQTSILPISKITI
jgi:hypothetical protein